MSKVTDTANAVIEIIAENNGNPVMSGDMYQGLMDRVGTWKYLHDAAAHLRESGILLVAEKHRQHSNWRIIDPDTESTDVVHKWDQRMIQEGFTEVVREAQALGLATHIPAFRKARNVAVARAVTTGAELGHDAATVLAMCEPVASTSP